MGHRTGGEVSARGGFTLLEVILTLFVLALVVGITLPTIGRSADAIRARADVAGFSAVFRHAREQAITTQRAYAVVVDPAAHSIKIVADEKDLQTRTLPERLTVQALLPPPATVYFQPHGVSSGGEFRVTSGNVAYRVTVDALTGRVKSERL